jgi:sulfite reductase alpha subunit-like flavoprotein
VSASHFPNTDDTLDRAGHNVLARLQRAARGAERNTQQALSMAHHATTQLQGAEDKIRNLDAEIRTYKERAEEWLRLILQEIEKMFPPQQPQQPQQPQAEDYARFVTHLRPARKVGDARGL